MALKIFVFSVVKINFSHRFRSHKNYFYPENKLVPVFKSVLVINVSDFEPEYWGLTSDRSTKFSHYVIRSEQLWDPLASDPISNGVNFFLKL